MNVVVIKRHSPDGFTSPIFMAIAQDVYAAKIWIKDEVDGLHTSPKHSYMQGKDAEWWIEDGIFSLTTVEVQA